MERSESVKVDISIFDESDPQEHQMKLLYGCGCNFGLRGNDEHTSLEVWNIVHGYFDSLHPCVGYEYYWMDSLPGKRHKLDVNNDQVWGNLDYMRLPVLYNNPWSGCLAGSIERFLPKLRPEKIQIFCKVVPAVLR